MKKLTFTVFVLILLCQCKEIPPSTRTQFPEVISPIYYLDTIHIESPVVFYADSNYYIMPETEMSMLRGEEVLDPYKTIRYFTVEDHSFKEIDYIQIYNKGRKKKPNSFYDLMIGDFYDLGNPLVFVEKINEYNVYKFKYKPKTFLLILMAREQYLYGDGDNISDVDYSLDYILAVTPIFHKKDSKKLIDDW